MKAMVEGGGGKAIAMASFVRRMAERLDDGGGPKFSRRPFFRRLKIPCAKKLKKGDIKIGVGQMFAINNIAIFVYY